MAISLGLFIAAILSDYIKSAEGFEDVPVLASYDESKEVFPGKLAEYDDDMDGGDDPRDLPWIASWSAADKAAREGHNCAVKFTTKGENGTTIITTSRSCEAGLPHTRAGDRIIIPDSVPEALKAEILEHEMYHILQKRDPQKWARFYANSWNFEMYKEPVGIPDHLVKARRGNPDTWQAPWCCWRSRYWPIPIYTNLAAPSLLNARTVWWDAWTNKRLDSEPEEWLEFFGSVAQPEHPHEISAVLLVAKNRSCEAGRRLDNWAALNLTNPFN